MKFSIITITYNSVSFLEQTVCSVLAQDHADFEYIFVDGGSTDGTLNLISRYARQDARIRFVSEPDRGISDAMNKGIRMATGDVIAHLHSDDYYPDASVLSSVNAEFERSHPYWVTGGMFIVSGAGERLAEIKVRDYTYQTLVEGNILLHPSTFVRSDAFEKVGMFDLSLKHAMDYDLWLRLGTLGNPAALNKPLSCFRAHAGSLSTFEAAQATKEEWLVRKRYLGKHYLRIAYHFLRYLRSKNCNAKFFSKLLKAGSDDAKS